MMLPFSSTPHRRSIPFFSCAERTIFGSIKHVKVVSIKKYKIYSEKNHKKVLQKLLDFARKYL
jgi:hypothetical protein